MDVLGDDSDDTDEKSTKGSTQKQKCEGLDEEMDKDDE